jgi:hypothetical protein
MAHSLEARIVELEETAVARNGLCKCVSTEITCPPQQRETFAGGVLCWVSAEAIFREPNIAVTRQRFPQTRQTERN